MNKNDNKKINKYILKAMKNMQVAFQKAKNMDTNPAKTLVMNLDMKKAITMVIMKVMVMQNMTIFP